MAYVGVRGARDIECFRGFKEGEEGDEDNSEGGGTLLCAGHCVLASLYECNCDGFDFLMSSLGTG